MKMINRYIPHPVKYSDCLLPPLVRLPEGYRRVLDPFAGPGKRRLTRITQAGLPLTITTSEEPLPPLVIDRKTVKRLAAEESRNE